MFDGCIVIYLNYRSNSVKPTVETPMCGKIVNVESHHNFVGADILPGAGISEQEFRPSQSSSNDKVVAQQFTHALGWIAK
jgi:hypothetical protein